MPSNVRSLSGGEWSPHMGQPQQQVFTEGFQGPGPNEHFPPGPPWGWGGHQQHHGFGCGCGCNHNFPPCPPGPGWDWNWRPPLGALRGPIIGVTDGSIARPGEVGEYLYAVSTITITAAQSGISQFVAPLVVPPGDWTCTLVAGAQFLMTGFNASLDPIPAGVRNASFVEIDMAPGNLNAYAGQRSFALMNAQPILITVNVHAQGVTASSFDSNNTPGQISAVIEVDARRMR